MVKIRIEKGSNIVIKFTFTQFAISNLNLIMHIHPVRHFKSDSDCKCRKSLKLLKSRFKKKQGICLLSGKLSLNVENKI